MKKRILILILTIPVLGLLSLGLSQEAGNNKLNAEKEVVIEDEIVVEDWMTKPFVVSDSTK